MEKTDSNYGWLIGIVIGLGIVYFIFMDKINKFLGFGKPTVDVPSQFGSCSSSFFVKLPDGKTQGIYTLDISETETPIYKYQKQNLSFNENGLNTIGDRIDITKAEFDSLCQYKYDPPYAWYKEIGKGPVTSGGHRR